MGYGSGSDSKLFGNPSIALLRTFDVSALIFSRKIFSFGPGARRLAYLEQHWEGANLCNSTLLNIGNN